MPLEILVPLVVAGIILAGLLVKFLINTPPRLLDDRNQVERVFLNDYPAAKLARKVLISDNKRISIFGFINDTEHIGFVEVFGSKHVTRMIGRQDLLHIKTMGERRVQLSLRDFTLPYLDLQFCDKNERDQALHLLEVIKVQPVFTEG